MKRQGTPAPSRHHAIHQTALMGSAADMSGLVHIANSHEGSKTIGVHPMFAPEL